MDDSPGSLNDMAVLQHEVFESYVRAGFTRFEALELIKAMAVEAVRSSGHGRLGED